MPTLKGGKNMIFKDINCGFFEQKRPLQYVCLHDEVAALAERNQIVSRAIYNYDKAADANEVTRRYAAATSIILRSADSKDE